MSLQALFPSERDLSSYLHTLSDHQLLQLVDLQLRFPGDGPLSPPARQSSPSPAVALLSSPPPLLPRPALMAPPCSTSTEGPPLLSSPFPDAPQFGEKNEPVNSPKNSPSLDPSNGIAPKLKDCSEEAVPPPTEVVGVEAVPSPTAFSAVEVSESTTQRIGLPFSSEPPVVHAQDRVTVVVRVRPPMSELVPYAPPSPSTPWGEVRTGLSLSGPRLALARAETCDRREFQFDSVLGPAVTQAQVYAAVAKPIVDSVLQGYHGTILAYGQTGAGKTFTVFGPDDISDCACHSGGIDAFNTSAGILPRAIREVMQAVSESPSGTFRVTLSCLEIYMERILDLIDRSRTGLNIREDPRRGVYVEDLTEVEVRSV
eukprot:RCo031008